MGRLCNGRFGKTVLTVIAGLHLFFFMFSTAAPGADLSEETVRQTIGETMATLLAGKRISPALQQRIDTIRSMYEADALSRAEIETMVRDSIFPILNETRTSRYILETMPELVTNLLSPYLTWEELRKIFWETCSSVIKEGDQMVVTIGTLAPDGTPWLNVPRTRLVPEMNRLSNGKFKVKIYGGGIMGEDTDILRKMDIGQLDGCGCTALGVLKASPETSVFLLPGLFNNYDEIDYIFKKFRKTIDAAFAERGYILAALIDTGFFHVFSKQKVTSLADIRKQKMLTWFGKVENTLFQELGINATPVAVPEVISALSTGLADTHVAPSAWMLGMQAYQYANYYVSQPLLYSPAAIIVSVQTKHRLQKRFNVSDTFAYNVQELLVFEVKSLESYWKEKVRSYERKSLEAFEKKCGMKPVSLSPEDMKTIATAGTNVQQLLSGSLYPEDMLQKVKAALKEYRAANRRP